MCALCYKCALCMRAMYARYAMAARHIGQQGRAAVWRCLFMHFRWKVCAHGKRRAALAVTAS